MVKDVKLGLRYEKEVKAIAKMFEGYSVSTSKYILNCTRSYIENTPIHVKDIDKKLKDMREIFRQYKVIKKK